LARLIVWSGLDCRRNYAIEKAKTPVSTIRRTSEGNTGFTRVQVRFATITPGRPRLHLRSSVPAEVEGAVAVRTLGFDEAGTKLSFSAN